MFPFIVCGECCVFLSERIRGCAANIVILGMSISFEACSTLENTSHQPYIGGAIGIERTLVVVIDEGPLFASTAP